MYIKSIIIAIVTLLAISGCAPSQYLADKPHVMYPQSILGDQSEDIQNKSMQALLASFNDRGWAIHNIDEQNSTITAEVCARGEHCSEVLASVNKNGSVELIRTPGQVLSKDEGDLLRRWIGYLNRSYTKHMKASIR